MKDLTKNLIADTMRSLMRRKPLDRIRVSEICGEAGIERPTFYYHFKDKYDLVTWIFFRNASDTDIVSVESAAKSMNEMKSDIVFYRRAYDNTTENPLWKYMLEYFYERYSMEAMERLGTEVLDVKLKYSIRLYCYGAVGMAKEWILEDNITPAQTAVKMMFDSMPGAMKSIFFSSSDSDQRT